MAKQNYTKRATDCAQQISLLESRGVVIVDHDKAKEFLLDIGYYRLGYYLYPFEKTYPFLDYRRQHDVVNGTTIENVVAFYYYDFDLRNILNRYLSRIEVAIRTCMIYELSNKYSSNPAWYVDPTVVNQTSFIDAFLKLFYPKIKEKEPVRRHCNKYRGYAPAWKTMEYMMFGNIEALYANLLSSNDQSLISNRFKESSIGAFKVYLSVVREVRNACAHGNVIALMTLTNNVRVGAACPSLPINAQNSFYGALKVIDYLLRQVSINRANDMWDEIYEATERLYAKSPTLRPLIESNTSIILPTRDNKFYRNCQKVLRTLKK